MWALEISYVTSYNERQQDALFLNFILVKNFLMIRTDLLSIIRSLNTVFTAIGICYSDILKIGKIACIYTVDQK